MTCLKLLEQSLDFTRNKYMEEMKDKIHFRYIEQKAINYSGMVLFKTANSKEGTSSTAYTRECNMRDKMANVSRKSIKEELLRNAVNVACYNIEIKSGAQKLSVDPNTTMSDDELAVVLYNNIVSKGVKSAYDLLDSQDVLLSTCTCFANYRRPGKKEAMDNIAVGNNMARSLHDKITDYFNLNKGSFIPMESVSTIENTTIFTDVSEKTGSRIK